MTTPPPTTEQTANPELELAEAFVRDTDRTVFLTGRAGTGKTTFLHGLKSKHPKRLVVTAPTGIAAINAGGVTLHSFFQLPFGPLVPGAERSGRHYRFGREKKSIVRSLDLLVIDEVSMVRADQLDAVDAVLRRLRRRSEPFGGVQLLLIGDLHQLSPVIRDDEWRLLAPHYRSPYFFGSHALTAVELVPIELKRVYRQSDDSFIRLLNQVRDGQLDADSLARLNARHRPDSASNAYANYITLCTHNRQADAINADRLEALPGQARSFEAEVTGDFPPHSYPTFATLGLKVGAQVMFVRNDPSPEKRFFNGKLGEVVALKGDAVTVQSPEDDAPILVEKISWENVHYTIDAETAAISAEVTGTFSQFPLKPAWAITIHKSQGLTFDRAIVDAEAAFAYGQVYVALSRCRTLEGLVLRTPLSAGAIKPDEGIHAFLEKCRRQSPRLDQLAQAARDYHQRLLLDCFDFRELGNLLGRLGGLVRAEADRLQITGASPDLILDSGREVRIQICQVGEKFRRQLEGLFPESGPPGEDAAVRERLAKAAAYFQARMDLLLTPLVDVIVIETDNAEVRRRLKRVLEDLREAVAVKRAAVSICGAGFSPEALNHALAQATLAAAAAPPAPRQPTYTEADVGHPELFEALKAWRAQTAAAEGLPAYRVLHQKTLVQIAVHLPDTMTALQAVKGIGDKLAERYGEALVAMVGDYRREHGIETVTLPPPPAGQGVPAPKKSAPPKVDTKQASLALFEEGLDIGQIAEKRQLATTTIEGHLAHWVAEGRLEIDRLVAADARAAIEAGVARWDGVSYKVLREHLENKVTYGEIKLVLAHLKRREVRGG